ncbi:hypothetical protein [Ruminococcus sp.]|uniref:hypothetical protein n=1 Tax=Ruminococcus sp. TaxID=41978 RepID=UPI0025F1DB40|nr:hypothetical protein [Ruminococcus sp.]MBQ8967630.1 hypothetical protein [Ruminococcus sp.]
MNMKKIGLGMSIMMGVTLSLTLSFVGTFTSGRFTLVGFLLSFLESLVISFVIGFFVPMKKVGDAACGKLGIMDRPLACRCVESLVSDLIYTPIITFVMVFMAYKQATSHGVPLRFGSMLGESMVISLVVAYLIIFLVTPNYMKFLMKKYGNGEKK